MGFLVVQALADKFGWPLKEERRFNAYVAKGPVEGGTMHLVLPTTYMNESGYAVRKYLDFYKLSPKDLMVACDDIALPFGSLRVRIQGSAGGHNGLKSVETHLRTKHYARLRMGIGRGNKENDLADFVLDRFTREETDSLAQLITKGVEVFIEMTKMNLPDLMGRVNRK